MDIAKKITPRHAALGATVAGVAALVAGVIHLTHEQSSESTIVGFQEHLAIGCFTVMLLGLAPVMLHLGRLAGRPRLSTAMAAAMTLLGLVAITSNVNGEDLAIFPPVAVVANLLWLVGSVVLAVVLRRERAIPLFVAIGLPLAPILALPLSAVGGSVVAGAFWLAVGWLLANGELPRPAARVAPAAA